MLQNRINRLTKRNAFKGSFFWGTLFVLATTILLWWNERKAVQNEASIDEAKSVLVRLKDPTRNKENDGKLVYLFAPLKSSTLIADTLFNVSSSGLKMRRHIEMYQWKLQSSTKVKHQDQDGYETGKIGEVQKIVKVWTSYVIPNDKFRDKVTYVNPTHFPIDPAVFTSDITAGDFTLSASMVNRIEDYQTIPINDKIELPNEQYRVLADRNIIYYGEGTLDNPKIGDCRIIFQEVIPKSYSFLAKQDGSILNRFKTESGLTFEVIKEGQVTPEKMFYNRGLVHTILKWMLRIGAFLFQMFGVMLILYRLAYRFSKHIVFGKVVEIGVMFLVFPVTLVWYLLNFSLAWFVFRPVFLIIALLIFFLAFRYIRKLFKDYQEKEEALKRKQVNF